MKVVIDGEGDLLLERGSGLKAQTCPFRRESYRYNCGDWCPHFGDIQYGEIKPGSNVHEHFLELCHGKMIKLGDFEDQRKYERTKNDPTNEDNQKL